MGRPLRAVYANSTYSTGVQEMSDSDITNLIAPLILNYVVANPNISYGTRLRTSATTYDVSRGTAVDTRNDAVGAHPASNSTPSTYEIFQSERAQTPALTARPVQYVMAGSEVQIKTMTDQDLYDYIYPAVADFMLTGGQGAYYLGLTSSGSPSGTWTSYGTLNDTYYVSSTLTTEQYTLWQRTDAATVGTIRPLKHSVYGTGVTHRLEEMTNADVEALAVYIGEYIRTTGIGQYAFQVSAPGTGTWISRGTYVNKINNLVDTGYIGITDRSFTGTFTGAYTGAFTGAYTGAYSRSFTGSYLGTYNRTFTGIYSSVYTKLFTGAYTGAYNQAFTGGFTGLYNNAFTGTFTSVYAGTYNQAFTGSFTGLYNNTFSRTFTGAFTGAYAGAYTGTFTGLYNQTFTNVYGGTYASPVYTRVRLAYFTGQIGPEDVPREFTAYYTGTSVGYYTGAFTAAYSGVFTGAYNKSFTGTYLGTYTSLFTGAFTSAYVGAYASNFTGAFSGFYTSIYQGSFTATYSGSYASSYTGVFSGVYSGSFAGSFTRAYTGNWVGNFTGAYSGIYTGAFSGAYSGSYNQSFTGAYNRSFTRAFTGNFTGLTVQASTTTTTYTLWVRTA